MVHEDDHNTKVYVLSMSYVEPLNIKHPRETFLFFCPLEKEQLTRLPRPLPLEGPRIHQPGTSGAGGGSGGGPGGTDNNSCPTPLVILPFNQTSPR